MFLWTLECIFDNPVENFGHSSQIFCWNFESKFIKLKVFYEKPYSQNCSSGHVEYSSDNPDENFLLKFPVKNQFFPQNVFVDT